MKKLFLLAAFVCLFGASAVVAQKNEALSGNFTGAWELDAAKSNLPERMRVESGTLVVSQNGKNLTVATEFKRAPRSQNAPQANENGGMRPEGNRRMRGEGGGGGAMMGGGNGTVSYSLDGKETKIVSEMTDGAPSSTLALKAETQKDGKLKLVSSRSFETQMGAMTVKTVDVWELLDNGKTLKITRETETPRGSQTAEMYFTRRAVDNAAVSGEATPGGVLTNDSVNPVYQAPAVTGADVSSVKMINGGVLNGKALKMPMPVFPPAAKAVRASGAVNVQITLDEQGKVIAAKAVSGHPLLKAAAEEAARAAEFAPTRLSGIPVKVTGILVYNFIP